MNDKLHKALTDDGTCLAPEELISYHEGNLRGEQLRKVEVHLAHCDLCSEAYDGLLLSGVSSEEFAADVNEINDRAWKRVEQLSRPQNRRPVIWLSAASVLLLTTAGLWFALTTNQDKQLNKTFAEQFTMPAVDSSLLAQADLQEADSISTFLSEAETVEPLGKEQMGAKAAIGDNSPTAIAPQIPAEESQAGPPVDAVTYGDDAVMMDEEVNDFSATETKTLEREESVKNVTPASTSGGIVTTSMEKPKRDQTSKQPKENGGRPAKASPKMSAADENQPAAMPSTSSVAEDLETYPAVTDSVSASFDRTQPSGFVSGLGAYQAQDYKSAVAQFNEVLKADPNHQEANFYAGVSYLGLEDAGRAIPCLEKAKAGSNAMLAEDAEWYLSLAYIKAKNKAKAKPLLEDLQRRASSPYQQRATEVLEDIRMP